MTPKKAIAAYLLTSIIFLLGLFTLYENLKPQLAEADSAIADGRAIVLEKGLNQQDVSDLLYDSEYVLDRKDADFIGLRIAEHLDTAGSIENLGALMKPGMRVPAAMAVESGGEGLRLRVENDYHNLGIAGCDFNPEVTSADSAANAKIIVKIKNGKGVDASLEGIPVRLKEYRKSDAGNGGDVEDRIVGFAFTDKSGTVTFGTVKGKFYSVVPVCRGFQYGREKGTTGGAMDEDLTLSFTQMPHTLTLLSTQTFSNIKLDRSMLVRTPAEFRDALFTMAITFILGWGLFFVFTFQVDKRRNTRTDYLLIIAIMMVTGIGLLASFGIWNPLTDTLYGAVMTKGLMAGLVVMGALMLPNYARLDAKLSGSRLAVFRKYGWGCLAAAVIVLAMLYKFGTGPEGSDAKVNLFGFQPSEIARVLIVIFIAWFFARKGILLQDFSQRLTRRTARRQSAVIGYVIAGIILLMAIYMLLSDMGPALVILVTFIFVYAMARRDFAQLLLGLFTFAVMMFVARWINNSTGTLLLMAALWFVGWIVLWYWKKRQIYESAIFLNIVLVVYTMAGRILEGMGQESLAARFTNRSDMVWEGVWNNEIPGGDQVVQGIWSLATGGFSGLGLGNGSPSVVPAGHTDMIFTTIGEMLGFVGLVLVVLCFFVIIHRTLLIGRRAGYSFPFYLAIGLGIVTGVQFIVIAGGSLGLIPLTGVTMPFLSYGRVSLIVSMASFGIVLSVSRLRATESQKEYSNSFNGSIVASSGLFLLFGIALLVTAARYQIASRGATLIRPAYVTTVEGARIVEYNPRIGLVLRRLEAGNIYDRNGYLLATSSRNTLISHADSLSEAGVTREMLDREKNKRKRRYYPFGAHTLFMLGDYNTLKVFGYSDNNPVGYVAEARHQDALRGIEIPAVKKMLKARNYKRNRFVAAEEREFAVREYDYTKLLDAGFLDYGIEHNPIVERHNKARERRDIYMAIDARLQTGLQNAMADAVAADPRLKGKPRLRASVVVLDAEKGDLLCSANYPLPDQDSIHTLNDRKIYGAVPFEKLKNHAPVTERDLGLTFQTQPGSTAKVMSAMAGFMKFGDKAAGITYDIKGEETIEGPAIEPWGNVSMETAIVKSSNCYFINLVHDRQLYPELDSIYSTVGIRVNPDDYIAKGDETPYFFNQDEFKRRREFDNLMTKLGNSAVNKYNVYRTDRARGNYKKMNFGETLAAWGQGPVLASPLNMARVASIVANSGRFTPTRYILRKGDKDMPVMPSKKVIGGTSADKLKSFMQKESDKHRRNGHAFPAGDGDLRMGGKTGTPERAYRKSKPNDAWYMFFIESETAGGPLAVAVRLERTESLTSGKAVDFVSKVVIPALNDAGYNVR